MNEKPKCSECSKELQYGYVKDLKAFTYFCSSCKIALVRTPLRPDDFGLKAEGKIDLEGWKHLIKVKK